MLFSHCPKRQEKRNSHCILLMQKFVLVLFLLTCIATVSFSQKSRSVNARGDWSGLEGVEIKAGNDKVTVNFNAGSAADCAQELVDGINGVNNFTASRVGTKVTITHPTNRPQICKVNISNRRLCAAAGTGSEFASENLIQIDGVAQGNGSLIIGSGTIKAFVQTMPGQTALEIAEILVQQIDDLTPDDPFFDFGVEFSVEAFGQGPIASVDVGINDLGGIDLHQTFFESTDPGISMNQEPCSPNSIRSNSLKGISIQVYPNPFTEFIQLDIESQRSTQLQIKLLTFHGSTIYTNIQSISDGQQFIPIHLNSDIPPGIYLIEIMDEDNNRVWSKIIGS